MTRASERATADRARHQDQHAQGAVEIVTSLRNMQASQWDALVGDNALASHGWLLASEEESIVGIEPRYVLLRQNGELVAAAACYLCPRGNKSFDPDRLMFRRLHPIAARLGLSFLPAMICCPFRCTGRHLLVHDRLPGDVRAQFLTRLLDAVEGLARTERLPLWFPQATEAEEETTTLLMRRNYHRTRYAPIVYMDLPWDSFQGYLGYLRSFSRNMTQVVRSEINRNRKAGVVIEEIRDPAVHRARLHELADRHYFRLNQRPVPYTPDFLPKLKEYLGDGLVLYGAFIDGALVGFSTLLRRGAVAYIPFVGLDRDLTSRNFTYFNLGFYRPIADAINQGIERIYAGKMLYRMKARRGFRTLRLHTFYRSSRTPRHMALQPFFALHRSWMARKLSTLDRLDVLRKLPNA